MDQDEHRRDDATAVDAMLNEGGRIQTGNLRRAATARSACLAALPVDAAPLLKIRSEGEPHV